MKNQTKSSWQDLPVRMASALFIIPIALFCIIYGGWFFLAMIGIISIAMTFEWARMFKVKLTHYLVLLFLVWPLVVYAAALENMWSQALTIAIGFAFIFGPQLWLGSAVIGCAGLSFLWLRFVTGMEMWNILWIVAVVIASDSFAYLTGKLIGGAKLMPSVSPGKTWSGAIGGLIGAACVGSFIMAYLHEGAVNAYGVGAVLGGLVGLVAQAGDLLESKLKRMLGVKDSGNIIPGHGGVLDRCDAMMAASIFMAVLSITLPSTLCGVNWNGGIRADKLFLIKDFPSVPVSLLR